MSKNVRPDAISACALPAAAAAERSAGTKVPSPGRRSRVASAIHRILAAQRARQAPQHAPEKPAPAAPVEWALRMMF